MGGMSPKEAKHEIDKEIEKHEHALHDEERSLMTLLQQRLLLEATG